MDNWKVVKVDKNEFWVFQGNDLKSIVSRNCYGKFSCGKEVCKMLEIADKCEHVKVVVNKLAKGDVYASQD